MAGGAKHSLALGYLAPYSSATGALKTTAMAVRSKSALLGSAEQSEFSRKEYVVLSWGYGVDGQLGLYALLFLLALSPSLSLGSGCDIILGLCMLGLYALSLGS